MRRFAVLALTLCAATIVACGGKSTSLLPAGTTLPKGHARLSSVKVSFSVPPGSGQHRRPSATRRAPESSRLKPQFIDYTNTTTIAISVSQPPGAPPIGGFSAQQAQLQINCPSANVTPCVISTTFQLPSAVPLLFVVTAFDSGQLSTGGTSVSTTLAPGAQTLTLTLGGAVTTLALSVSPATGVAGTPQTISLTPQTATDPDGLTFQGPFATPVPVTGYLDGGYLPPFATATTSPVTFNGQPYMNVANAAFPNTGSTATITYTGLFDGQDAILDVFNQTNPVEFFTARCPPGTPMCASLITPTFSNGLDLPSSPGSLASYHGKVYLTDNNQSIIAFDPATGNQTRISSGSGASLEPSAGVNALISVGNVLEVFDGNGFSQFTDSTQTFAPEAPLPSNCSLPSSGSPVSLTVGQDGNVWYSGGTPLSAFNPNNGACNAYQLQSGTSVNSSGEAIAAAGNSIWFLNQNFSTGSPPSYGYIPYNAPPTSPVADVEFPIPGGHQAGAITKGPDGNIWIADSQAGAIYKVDAQVGSPTYGRLVQTFTISAPAIINPSLSFIATDTVNASDARYLYFTDQGDGVLGRLDPSSGTFTFFTPKYIGPTLDPFLFNGPFSSIAFDGAGNVYFTNIAAGIDGSGKTVGIANVSVVSSSAIHRGTTLQTHTRAPH